MIRVTKRLEEHLHTGTSFLIFDLYEVTLTSGRVLRWTDCEIDLQHDGKTYERGPLFKREKTKQTLGIAKDVLSFHMYVTKDDAIDGTPVLRMAQSGALDGATMVLYSAFLDDNARVIDTIELFQGTMAVTEIRSLDIQLKIKPKTATLSAVLPNRLYYPSCPYTLFSEACGLDREQFKIRATIRAVDDTTITLNISKPADWFGSGILTFRSGVLRDTSVSIVASKGNTVRVPLPFIVPPSPGDSVELLPGCHKTREECREKFDNVERWRGTPFVPRKEETT